MRPLKSKGAFFYCLRVRTHRAQEWLSDRWLRPFRKITGNSSGVDSLELVLLAETGEMIGCDWVDFTKVLIPRPCIGFDFVE